jgi:hypothetical protein
MPRDQPAPERLVAHALDGVGPMPVTERPSLDCRPTPEHEKELGQIACTDRWAWSDL